MGLFDWFSDWMHSDVSATSSHDDPFGTESMGAMDSSDDFAVNPANGLPMIDGTCGVDVEGNPFGTDFSHDSMTSSGFDDSFSSSSMDDSWSSSADSGFSDW